MSSKDDVIVSFKSAYLSVAECILLVKQLRMEADILLLDLSEELNSRLEHLNRFLDQSQSLIKRGRERTLGVQAAGEFEGCLDKLCLHVEETLDHIASVLYESRYPWKEMETEPLVKAVYSFRTSLSVSQRLAAEMLASLETAEGFSIEWKRRWNPRLFQALSLTLAYTMREELFRRQRRDEDKYGKLVREFLVNRDDDLPVDADGTSAAEVAFEKLLRAVTGKTRDLPFSDSTDEKHSIATEKIFNAPELKGYLSMPVLAAGPQGFKAIVDGTFNKVSQRIRDRIRTALETELRQQRIKRPLSVNPDENKDNWRIQYNSLHVDETPEQIVFSTRLRNDLEDKLTPRQRVFFNIRYDEGCTQAEAARRLGITRQAALDFARAIQKKYRELAS